MTERSDRAGSRRVNPHLPFASTHPLARASADTRNPFPHKGFPGTPGASYIRLPPSAGPATNEKSAPHSALFAPSRFPLSYFTHPRSILDC